MATNKHVAAAEKKYKELVKLQKKGGDPCDLASQAEDFYRPPVRVALIEEGELGLKNDFEELIEDLQEACKKKKK